MDKKDKVFDLVKKIQRGRVSTYKLIAKKSKLHPRQVARILSEKYDKRIPCHRVVYSNGRISGYDRGIEKKIALLNKEGIKIHKGKISNFENDTM